MREGRVIAAGRRGELDGLIGPATRSLALAEEHVVVPGVTDAHLHLYAAAVAARQLDLETCATADEAIALVARAHAERLRSGESTGWILGRGWSPDRWGVWPTAAMLDEVAPGRPAAFWSHDHHTRWISSSAARLAGIDPRSADPPGGIIGRDEAGDLSGILYEKASTLVDHAIPETDEREVEAGVLAYARELISLGIVGCHDPGDVAVKQRSAPGVELYRRLASEGRLPLRVHASVRAAQLDAAIEHGLRSGSGVPAARSTDRRLARVGGRFRFGWLKLFADGTLGSRTAALLAPYEVEPGAPPPAADPAGMLVESKEELARLARSAADVGIGTQIHAIGDRAVRVALDALEPVAPASIAVMPRVEHIQLLDPIDRPRFASSRIAASIQPVHLRDEWLHARRAWGDRTRNSYPCASLAASGAVLAFGTDAPVESPDPWPGIGIAVRRHDASWGEATEPFEPQEAVELSRAFRAACLDPVVAAGEEEDGGRLVPGHRADFLVLPAGAFGDDTASSLATTRPLATFLDGEAVFRSSEFDR